MTAPTPALYVGYLTHVRRVPVRWVMRHRVALWLVDLDDLPVLPRWLRPFARFSAADHLGAPDRPIRSNVDDWLERRGIDLGGGRVLMLTTARVLGYAFNPLTVYWCNASTGVPVCVIAEVSNTYGERHRYLLPARRETEVSKDFRVSPFFAATGRYRMRLPVPGERLSLTISLLDDDATLLTAVLNGDHHPVTPRRVLALVLTGLLAPHRVIALIRMHGIRLWLRGLPIRSGPHYDARKGYQ